MRRLLLFAIAAAVVPLVIACGGGDKTVKTPGGGEVKVGNDLPDSFPSDFPIYKGAKLQSALQGKQQGIEGTAATWTTGDSFNDVKTFYDKEFTNGPWKSQGNGTISGSQFWTVKNDGNSMAAYVTIADGNPVSIVAYVGTDAGDIADGELTPSGGADATPDGASTGSDGGTLPNEVDLPADFPKDKIPLPDDARVTNASTINSSGTTVYSVILYSKKTANDLDTFFKDKLEGNGFTQSFQTSTSDGILAAYAENADGTGLTVQLTVSNSDVSGYRAVSITASTQ